MLVYVNTTPTEPTVNHLREASCLEVRDCGREGAPWFNIDCNQIIEFRDVNATFMETAPSVRVNFMTCQWPSMGSSLKRHITGKKITNHCCITKMWHTYVWKEVKVQLIISPVISTIMIVKIKYIFIQSILYLYISIKVKIRWIRKQICI